MSAKQPALFEDRFLESFTGTAIINDQKVAIMELIANAWDAGATEVHITWPIHDGDKFSILDNGHGMTKKEFDQRFRTLAYDRTKKQGLYAEIPPQNKEIQQIRPAFGKNGKGRFGGFSFGEDFFVRTWKNNKELIFRVLKNRNSALDFPMVKEDETSEQHGTEIYVERAIKPELSAGQLKKEVSMRFLTDPYFKIYINKDLVELSDIPEENVETLSVPIDNLGTVKITIIDIKVADKTTHSHGIAWHVNRRLVGECTWKDSGSEHLIDGRKALAKRYTFIVEADFLKDHRSVILPDWTGFYPNNDIFTKINSEVQKSIRSYLLNLGKEHRKETLDAIKKANSNVLRNMPLIGRERWETFVISIQEECPSLTDDDLQKLSSVLANLEDSDSKYKLIHQLSELNPNNLDDLNNILEKWNIDLAKIVLDELEYRLKLLEQLKIKVKNENTDEVQELQPLFHRGLWIFGPEYETIEYTSNQGMTTVIQELFGDKTIKGSLKRPDFAILTDGTVGFYGYPKYDRDGGEIGIDRLTIVELKKPKIPIGKEQKNQAWKYAKELYQKGQLKEHFSTVTCFVLGSELEPFESGETTEFDKQVRIIPLTYDTVILRAKSRLLKLYDKVSNAPFLKDTKIKEYLKEREQKEIFIS